MATRATWNDLELVVRGLFERQEGPLPITARFAIDTDEKLQALQACLDADYDTNLRLGSGNLAVGQTVEIELDNPRIGFGLLVSNVDGLLVATWSARVREPAHYLVLDELISKTDVRDDGHLITRYRAVLDFIQTLKRSAAYLDSEEQTLVFIRNGKFEIPCSYGVEDLRSLQLDAVRQLAAIVPTGTYEKQCQAIMADAVTEMTKHLPAADSRFSHLLGHAAELKKRYEDGYNMFASGFSYEKVRDQVEAARVEYTGKIHKVFADIQNQLLGIPVATIIVATQMKDATTVGYGLWVNVAVLIGCWVFAVLMMFVLHNQSQTLEVVRTEIERQKRQLEKEYAAVAGSFSDVFSQLTRRAETQRRILWTIGGFVALGLILSHVVFIELTAPAREALLRMFSWLGGFP
jgi:hypothetical protein